MRNETSQRCTWLSDILVFHGIDNYIEGTCYFHVFLYNLFASQDNYIRPLCKKMKPGRDP